MKRIGVVVAVFLAAIVVASLGTASYASAKSTRDFAAGFWGDGVRWGTVVTPALLPSVAPAGSFDKFLVVTNSNTAGGQAPIVEAAPGNSLYNGGRWVTYTVVWTADGFADHGGMVPLLTSYADVMFHEGLGHLTLVQGSPSGGPPEYFECPLVPFSG
ncbi:MAG TPA: hypothetical protein VJ224_04215 [Thermoplasmata archaeon]|nr:hypothetical protein [Thermoplasmata archaeon]